MKREHDLQFYIKNCHKKKILIKQKIDDLEKLRKVFPAWASKKEASKYFRKMINNIQCQKLYAEKKLIEYQKNIAILRSKNGN